MHLLKTLTTGLALLVAGMLLSSSATSNFEGNGHHIKFPWPHCFKDISSSGNLSGIHFGLAEMKLNTKNDHLHMKSERHGIRNSSCEKYSEHHLPGYLFCFPSHWGLECHYQVWAHDCDSSHDEKAKLHGHSSDNSDNDGDDDENGPPPA